MARNAIECLKDYYHAHSNYFILTDREGSRFVCKMGSLGGTMGTLYGKLRLDSSIKGARDFVKGGTILFKATSNTKRTMATTEEIIKFGIAYNKYRDFTEDAYDIF